MGTACRISVKMSHTGLVGNAHPTWRTLVVALGIVALVGAGAQACSVPVFRYALERFEVDPYEFVVFHRGPLAPDVKPAIDTLAKLLIDLRVGVLPGARRHSDFRAGFDHGDFRMELRPKGRTNAYFQVI